MKKYDAVKTTRDIRDRLGERWRLNAERQCQDLARTRGKYGIDLTRPCPRSPSVAESPARYPDEE